VDNGKVKVKEHAVPPRNPSPMPPMPACRRRG
jgi:hypothetical protein